MIEALKRLVHTLLDLSPQSMNDLAHYLGPWLYVALAAIVFAETGLVATPFLPGDSLLFAVGAVGAMDGSPINLPLVGVLLILAAIAGDAVNYMVGARLGPKVFRRDDSWLLNKKHLAEAQRFYDRHGAKTIILARFIPIVRTFAPFVAGIGRMSYVKFAIYNVVGAISWVTTFLVAGWWFGTRPAVQKNFKLVIAGIIVVSVLPAAFELLRSRLRRNREAAAAEPTPDALAAVAEPPAVD